MRRKIKMSKLIDLVGRKFGRLTVVARAPDRKTKSGTRTMWFCDCDCNTKNVLVYGTNLTRGLTQSCGCLRKENSHIINKQENTFEIKDEYVIGYDKSGNKFYIEIDDLEKIKKYYWRMESNGGFIAYIPFSNGKQIKMHRYIMDCYDEHVVDHINHDRFDNRRSNLRIVEIINNTQNQPIKSNNTSGCPGVCWNKRKQKWMSRITVNKNKVFLGYYDDIKDAIKVRKEAEEKYFKQYSYDNSMKLSERIGEND